jgi:hypothetical protein
MPPSDRRFFLEQIELALTDRFRPAPRYEGDPGRAVVMPRPEGQDDATGTVQAGRVSNSRHLSGQAVASRSGSHPAAQRR